MIELLFAIFIITCLFAFFAGEHEDQWLAVYLAIGAVLVLYAAFRPIGFDYDSPSYLKNFLKPKFGDMEPTFYYLSLAIYALFADVRPLFIVYAILGVSLKMFAFTRLTKLWFLALIVYISNFYILHEMTQIRAGIATGIFLIAVRFLADGHRLKYIYCILVAMLFHYSAVAFIPFVFINNRVFTRRQWWVWFSLIPISYFFYFYKLSFLLSLNIPFLQDKIEAYQVVMDAGLLGDDVNAFNLVFLTKIAITMFIMLKYRLIAAQAPYTTIIVKLCIVASCCFNFFSFFAVISFRLSEIFSVTEILLFPLLYYAFKPEWVGKCVVMLAALVILMVNLYYNQLLNAIP